MPHSVSFSYPNDFLDAELNVSATVSPGIPATRMQPADPPDFEVDSATLRTTAGDVELGAFLSDETLEKIFIYYCDNEAGKD